MSSEAMKVNRDKAFASPAKARKLARDVKKQAELRQRLTVAVSAVIPRHTKCIALAVDAVIEELKK